MSRGQALPHSPKPPDHASSGALSSLIGKEGVVVKDWGLWKSGRSHHEMSFHAFMLFLIK